jgi:hypothetical protein
MQRLSCDDLMDYFVENTDDAAEMILGMYTY